jgi:hypothetical protein
MPKSSTGRRSSEALASGEDAVRLPENGESLDDFLAGFPTVSRAIAVQVLEESTELRLARV